MSTDTRPVSPPDLRQYLENRPKIAPEKLIPYAGQHIAWSPDDLRILASGPDLQAVLDQLHAAGIDPGQVIHDYVDPMT
jgi:hypothetical protein